MGRFGNPAGFVHISETALLGTMADLSLSNRKKYHILLCICVLVFAASLLFRLVKLVLDPGLMRDATLYLQWVENWFETGDYHFYRLGVQVKTAVLPLWIMKTFMFSGFGVETTCRALGLFLGSMIPVIGFMIAWALFKKIRLALLSAVLLIIHPDLVTYSIQPLRDNFYIFFEALLLLMMILAIKRNSSFYWAICGVFTSLIAFSRYEGLEFFAIVPFVIAAMSYFKKQKWKHAVVNIAAFSILFGTTSVFLLSLTNYDVAIISKLIESTKSELHNKS